jgi:tyrosyl-tRNA synthetase
LDSEKTSPYQFYQFWLNAADADAKKWIKIFTFLNSREIDELIERHQTDPSKRTLQKKLAKEITIFVHGEEEYNKAIETTAKLFAQQSASAESFSEQDLQSMEGVQRINYEKQKLEAGIDVISFLAEASIFTSKGEARKMIQNGGVSINRKKVDTLELTVDGGLLLHKKYLLIQKGKKNYYLVEVQ